MSVHAWPGVTFSDQLMINHGLYTPALIVLPLYDHVTTLVASD